MAKRDQASRATSQDVDRADKRNTKTSGAARAASDASRHLRHLERRERDAYLEREAHNRIVSSYAPPPPLVLMPIRIAPDPLIEHRPAWLEFYVWNRASENLDQTFVRATITPRQSVDDYPALFEFPIGRLETRQTVVGAISFTLPRADLKNRITLELCRAGDIPAGGEFAPTIVLASATQEFDVGARFTVSMQGIHIRDTASRDEDTVFASLTGMRGERPWSDARNLGDHDNTGRGGLSPGLAPIGPLDVLPGDADPIAISCVVANAGHTSEEEDAKKALKVVSHVGAVTATTVMSIIFPVGAGLWAGLSEAADVLHQAILDWALADCDTVVLNEARLASGADLFLYSLDPHDAEQDFYPAAWVMHMKKRAGQRVSEWLGEGCRDSDYSVTLALHRHRVPEMFHNAASDGLRLAPGQRVTFGPIGHDVDLHTYEVEGAGQITPLGLYEAPATSTDRRFDVVKWTVYRDTKRGREAVFTDFAVVLLD